ncbi:hypothetical protein HanRHA438_Chr13g0620981 [Helianthus annuus]|nr:hypothetical protein HanRHA438_Chr13g0620981 [Helianthus annuus]
MLEIIEPLLDRWTGYLLLFKAAEASFSKRTPRKAESTRSAIDYDGEMVEV